MTRLGCLISTIVLASPGLAFQSQACQEAKYPNEGSWGVAVQGDSALIAVEGEVQAYVRTGSSWSLEDTLTPGDGTPFFGSGALGSGIDLDGGTAIVRAQQSAFIFVRNGGSWTEQAKLVDPTGAAPGFGHAVAISGDLAVVGDPSDSTAVPSGGSVWVFERTGANWALVAKRSGAWDYGASVAIDGTRLIVGDPATQTYQSVEGGYGSAEILTYAAGALTSEGFVIDFLGDKNDEFGYSVVAGSPGANRVFVFDFNGSFWEEHSQLKDPAGDVGWSAAIDGDKILIGSPGKNSSTGRASLFVRSQNVWNLTATVTASDGAPGDRFGEVVALDGTSVAAVAPQADGLSPDSGATYLFGLHDDAEAYCSAGTSALGCQAALSASGLASASSGSGFTVTATGVEGGINGLYFFGQNGRQANPWGNGTSLQCVIPPVKRAGLLLSTGTPGLCDGSFSQDLNARWCPTCPKPGQAPVPGTELQVQLWYRDAASTSNQTTGLSDALGVGVCP